MRVELLYWDGDPDYMRTRQNLVEVLTEDAFETTIQMIAVSSQEDATFLQFPGSPTIRINGQDIHPPEVEGYGLRLRGYPADEGTERGTGGTVPGKRLIRRAIDRARGWSHSQRD